MNTVSVQNRTAAKKHRCDSCQGIIEKGETYVATFLVDGGDSWTWKDHILCDKIGAIRLPYYNDWGDEVTRGWLNDDMADAGFQDKDEYLKHLENNP